MSQNVPAARLSLSLGCDPSWTGTEGAGFKLSHRIACRTLLGLFSQVRRVSRGAETKDSSPQPVSPNVNTQWKCEIM